MNQSELGMQALELHLQNNSCIELLEQLDTLQKRGNNSGMALDVLKFLILEKMAKDFASTASNPQSKWGFMQVASTVKIELTAHNVWYDLTTIPSTSSPSN